MKQRCKLRVFFQCTVATFFLFALWLQPALAQDATQKPAEKLPAKSAEKTASSEKAVNPAQIELLETKVRFESNGDSRKEVHALVKINSELGVRQFAKLNFDYNRSFESIDIPLVHITHASGGTADILPSAITDQPNPAVVNAPAYQDVRVKSVRILGLEPGDTLEYRVITTVSHHPLAPDFWLEHSFDHIGIVTQESFELDIPTSHFADIRINPATPAARTTRSGDGDTARAIYYWLRSSPEKSNKESSTGMPDLLLTTFVTWVPLSERLNALFEKQNSEGAAQIAAKAADLGREAKSSEEKLESFYEYVSQKISTADLRLGSTGFMTRPPSDIISSGTATAEDKYALFRALCASAGLQAQAFLTAEPDGAEKLSAFPGHLRHLLVGVKTEKHWHWLDPSLEVAPFGMIPSEFRGKRVLRIADWTEALSKFPTYDIYVNPWVAGPVDLPFKALQSVNVSAVLDVAGKLSAKVHYKIRGDNELLLRVAFHQSPKEKWKELAQLLSITDGFRGQVTSVNASDPYATKEPFTLEYEIEQPKFVNWSKKTVRIPALLPQIGLPDPPVKPAPDAAISAIDLGTPLEVETQMTLRLPPGTAAQPPTGTSVQRDYATYASQYSAKGLTITASRHINFLLRKIPADRAADYGAFLHAVQNDEAQDLTLEQPNPAPPGAKPAEAKTQPPNKTEQPKP
jgi:hypothetical protein